jgi:hypothetical protein
LPIDSDEFAKGKKITGIERTVLQFLKQNNSRAYTQPEILTTLYRMSTHARDLADITWGVITALSVDKALETLVKERSVLAKELDHETYYMAA